MINCGPCVDWVKSLVFGEANHPTNTSEGSPNSRAGFFSRPVDTEETPLTARQNPSLSSMMSPPESLSREESGNRYYDAVSSRPATPSIPIDTSNRSMVFVPETGEIQYLTSEEVDEQRPLLSRQVTAERLAALEQNLGSRANQTSQPISPRVHAHRVELDVEGHHYGFTSQRPVHVTVTDNESNETIFHMDLE